MIAKWEENCTGSACKLHSSNFFIGSGVIPEAGQMGYSLHKKKPVKRIKVGFSKEQLTLLYFTLVTSEAINSLLLWIPQAMKTI